MSEEKHKGERIAKRIARAGVCSRRDAEKLITGGQVKVNGKVIDSPALNVVDEDHIVVNGKPLPEKQETRMFMYHKPPGLVTTHKDEQGRSTVFENLPEFMPRVVSVGRLDLNTEGLLLLTNDGELSRYLELPETGWARRYRVRVNGKVDEKRLKSLKNGITVEGVRYKSIEAVLEKPPEGEEKIGANSWLSVTLREGKNREVRRVMEKIGLRVTRLIRTDYGPFSLGKMTRGSAVEVKPSVLKDQIPKFFGDEKRRESQVQQRQKRQGKRPDEKGRTFDKNQKNRKFDAKKSKK